MSIANKPILEQWFERVWNRKEADAIDELMAPDCRVYGLEQQVLVGPSDFKRFHSTYVEAFPDVRLTLEDIVSEGDLVAARWSGTGTHRGHSLGFMATQKETRLSGMTFARVRNGRIVEGWNIFDQLGMLAQLGAVKLPE